MGEKKTTMRHRGGGFSFFFNRGFVTAISLSQMVSPKQLLSTIESALLGPSPPTSTQRLELLHAIRTSIHSFHSLLSYPAPKSSDRIQVQSKSVRISDLAPITLDDQDVQIVLAATQSLGESGNKWFQGTADAVRQFLWLFEDSEHKNIENVLILCGDQLYRMDYMELVQKHINSCADISVSCLQVDGSRASDFGLVKVDERGQIRQFLEKPKGRHTWWNYIKIHL